MKAVLLILACVSATVSSPALAAKSPTKVSAKCRQTIAKAVESLAKAGLKEIEQCHKLRDKGKSTADCNVIAVGATTIQLGNPKAESLGKDGAPRAGLEQLKDAGIGVGPLSAFDALVRSGDAQEVASALAHVDGVRSAAAPAAWRRDGTAIVVAVPTADANSPEGRQTLDRIREAAQSLPADVTVGGEAAQSADFLDELVISARQQDAQDQDLPPASGARKTPRARLMNLSSGVPCTMCSGELVLGSRLPKNRGTGR